MFKKIITLIVLLVFLLPSYVANARTIHQPDHVAKFRTEKDVGIINLQGEIDADSADVVKQAFENFHENKITEVLIHLHSLGGKLNAGGQIIDEIIDARKHKVRVIMLVDHGEYCASMCTGIYAVGSSRIVATDTIWGFHAPFIKMTEEEENDPVKKKAIEEDIKQAKKYMLSVYSYADKKWTEKVLKKYVTDPANGSLILSGEDILEQSETWFTGIVGD